MSEITRAFEILASWIVAMANGVLDNEAAAAAASDTRSDVGGSETSTSAPTRPTAQLTTKGSSGGKASAPTTPTISATKAFTLRSNRGDGDGSQNGGAEASETSPKETKKENGGDDLPAQKDFPATGATTPASTSTKSHASTKYTSPSTTTSTSCSSISSTLKTSNPEIHQEQERADTPSTDNSKPPQEQQPLPKRPQPVPLRSMTPLSSFLAAKKVDPDGYPRDSHSASSILEDAKKRGLAEIVGKEEFFVELHASFVVVLAWLVSEFGIR